MLETVAELPRGTIRRVQIPLKGSSLMARVNVHLLEGPEGLVVMDFGPPGAVAAEVWDRLLPYLATRPGPVRLMASHMHGDHIGMAARASAALGAPLMMAGPEWDQAIRRVAREGAVMARDEARFLALCGLPAPLPPQHVPFEISLPPRGPDLIAGQILRMAGADWHAVMVPGHSAAMTCFYQPDADLILSGDAILPAVVPVTIPDLDRADHDPVGNFLTGLTRLEHQGLIGPETRMLPGHGDPQPDALQHLRRIRSGLEKRNDRLLAALAAGPPASLWELLPVVFRNGAQVDDHSSLLLSVVMGHLRHLALAGAIRLEMDRHGTLRATRT